MKSLLTLSLILLTYCLSAKNYFVAVNGSDSNQGSLDAPFASLQHAQELVVPGDSVFIRGGTYKITENQIMKYSSNELWAYVFEMDKSGLNSSQKTYYGGYRSERPVFDLSAVRPKDKRVIVFHVSGSNLHFKNFEIIGTQVTIIGHTQSECFRNEGGNYNTYEHLAMHDGMAIGFYLTKGSHNMILNCDAYNNYDPISDGGKGGNVDGFGGHPTKESSVGNIFKACRAWYNSDDGFDLINSKAAVTIEDCWSFYNGYQPKTLLAAGDGSGFKSGGYGMSSTPRNPRVIPKHKVINCLAYHNRNQGFYANHHLGGISWINNTGYQNPSNFNMLNRKSAEETKDVPGYGHIIKNNVSYDPRVSKHITQVDLEKCELSNNSFSSKEISLSDSDFVGLDASELALPRKEDGSLPKIDFLRPKEGSILHASKMGYTFKQNDK
ncbi:DUF4990 domain-containing protein [Echinicola sp. 20G]|uniref:right-handed parallel beta-helix repeat-containing protein n=1 Tax=Echinicola sp. 20G TaxID=2781961 RepID=UPI0019109313|nr:DUF4990 domain-containing protein [Echinicola sp. 20G]